MTARFTLLCYRRRSVVKQDRDLISPERQAAAVTALAQLHGLTPEWYEDLALHNSGRTAERPGWQLLLSQLDRPDVAGIAAYDLSRLYRNVREFLALVDNLEHRGLALCTVKENIDTQSAAGRAILTILMTMYQLESDLASERMTENIRYKRETLHRHWGPAPYGTTRDTAKNLIPDPVTHPTLLHLYQLYATGAYTYDSLAATLNADGCTFTDRHGAPRPFTRDDTRRLLAAWQLYAGALPLGRQKDRPTQIIPEAHAPLLPPELCAQVGVLLSERRHRFRSAPRRVHLLNGLAYCGACGKPLTRLILIEIQRLHALATGPAGQQLSAQIAADEERLTRLTDALIEGLISKVDFRQRSLELQRRIDETRSAVPDDTAADTLARELERIQDLLRRLPAVDPREQRAIIRGVINRVEIKGGNLSRLYPQPWAKDFF